MLGYNVRLALKSFKRNPGLTALMVGAIGLGIAACVITTTLYHAMSANPIWWKSDRLFAVTMDAWDPRRPYDKSRPQLAPPLLAYKDAIALSASNIPARQVIMHRMFAVVTGAPARPRPESVTTRVTTSDFFSIFDVPFLYGSGWGANADRAPEPVIVLSREENEKLFGGVNSVGRTIRWNEVEFRIIGVLDRWFPIPKFYDLNNGSFRSAEDVYIPFGWTAAREKVPQGGNYLCWVAETVSTFKDYLNSDCLWIQMWVELPGARARELMRTFLDSYWARQHAAGRFARPRNNHLTDVNQWLVDQRVVGNDDRMLIWLAFAFLAVCLINTVGLLLAKFLSGAALTGVRRALGASRRQVVVQHLVETGVLATAGALLGLVLAALGLWILRTLYSIYGPGREALARFDIYSIVIAMALAGVAALAAGLYPAWRVGRLPPAVYLKSQ